jgi:hypothetical protein
MEKMMEAMADKSRLVDGKPTSLLELGYNNCGLVRALLSSVFP